METPTLSNASLQQKRSGMTSGSLWLLAAGSSLVVYAATVCPDVLMMDYGEYQRATWLFPHNEPPQDSLVRVHVNYLLLAKAFGLLMPIGQWAGRINLFSAVAGSVAVANACVLTLLLTRSMRAAGLAWLVVTFGQITWLYSAIAHSASLQAAAVSAEILMLYLWATSGNVRWLLGLWAINGFAAGIHMQDALATPVYLALLAIAWQRGQVALKHVALCLGIWLVGFAPYLIYCLHYTMTSQSDHSALTSMTVGHWGGEMGRLNPRVWLKGLLAIPLNYPTGLGLLAIPGVVALVRGRWPKELCWAYLAVIGINLLFATTYNIPDQQRYFTMVFVAAAPIIGLGASRILRSRLSWMAALALAVLVIPIYAALPAVVRSPLGQRLPLPKASALPYRDPYEFYLKPWKVGWHNDRRYLDEILETLPQDAVFICSSTVLDGLETVRIIESRRMDIMPGPSAETVAGNLDVVTGQWHRPVYSWSAGEGYLARALSRHCRLVERGVLWEVLPPHDPQGLLDALLSSNGSG